MTKYYNIPKLRDRRKELRNEATLPEKILWRYLKGQKLGVKFRRQYSLGGYILDFYCIEKKLVIELDGQIHNKQEAREYDKVRDKFFIELGCKVLRFPNSEVENSIKVVLQKIKTNL